MPPPPSLLLLQKLEEFLFGMEENHAEVGDAPNAIRAIKVSVTLTGSLAGTQTDQLDDLNLNMTSVALPAAWSILIYMRDSGGRLTGHST